MKYSWMLYPTMAVFFAGGYALSKDLTKGIILLVLGFILLLNKWRLQNNYLKEKANG